jgi:NDP-sugar pyrophosphorylase family protein
MKDIRVVILAGGKGTRLKPYTTVIPKPLMPIGDMPILEVVLRQLKSHGFQKVTLSVNHLAELLQTFFGDGSKLGIEISYCVEDKPMGTAGSLSLVKNITEPFLVMNGDLLTTLDYRAMVTEHIKSGSIATIGVSPRKVKIDFGVLDIDQDGSLLNYTEKPTLEYLVSMGVNVFSRQALDFIAYNEYLDIPTLMVKIKNAGKRVDTYRSDCEWLDIGRPEDYENAIEAFMEKKDRYLKQ